MNIHRYTTPDKASEAVANFVVEVAQKSIQEREKFTVALSGGSSPKPLYNLLASDRFRDQISWKKTYIFWGDERFVPPDDPENNARMARETLLDHVPVPSNQIFPIPTDGRPQEAAERYASTIASVFDDTAGFPRFDLILLGLGENGHTASLFPHTTVLEEHKKWTDTIYLDDKDQSRITLTAPVINQAKNIAFLVFGEKKANILSKVIEGPRNPQQWPAQLISPSSGSLHWYIDEAAGRELLNY